ncbi:MAG: SixA phosphatase family protein [Pseudomonadota bacterium]
MTKTLIIIRHAHRDTDKGRELNNGLSDKGRKQVRKVFDFYFERFPEIEKPILLSSGRKRCMETLEPLARKLERRLTVNPLLMEQTSKETTAQFKQRVRRFKKEWEKSTAELTLICSHGDWIPVFLKELLGTTIHLKKGGWAEVVQLEDPELTWLIQEF